MVIFDVLTLLLPAWLVGQFPHDASSPAALAAEVQALSPQELRAATALSGSFGGSFGGGMRGGRSGGMLSSPHFGSLSKGDGATGESSQGSRKSLKGEEGFAPLPQDLEKRERPARRGDFRDVSGARPVALPPSGEVPSTGGHQGAHYGAHEHSTHGSFSYAHDFRQRMEEAGEDPQLLQELLDELQEKMEAIPPVIQAPQVEQPVIQSPVAEPEVAEPVVAEQPKLEGPVIQEPMAEPVVAEPEVAEQPKLQGPVIQEPMAEPVVAEPEVAERPKLQGPVIQEPMAEPVVAEPVVAERPKLQEPVIQEPVIQEPVAELLLPPVIPGLIQGENPPLEPKVDLELKVVLEEELKDEAQPQPAIVAPPPPPPPPMMGPPPPPLPKFLGMGGLKNRKLPEDLLKARAGLNGGLVAGMDNLQAELQGRILKFRERLDAKAALQVVQDEEESPVFDKDEMERRMISLRGPVVPKPIWYQGRYVAPNDSAYGEALDAQNARIADELKAGAARRAPKVNAAPLNERQQKIRDRIFQGVRQGGAPMALADLLKGAKGKGLKAVQGQAGSPQVNEEDKAKNEFLEEILAKAKVMKERRRGLGHTSSHRDEDL